MASHDAKADAWTILIARWPFMEKDDRADVLRKEWNRALDVLTDAQVAESLDYLRTRYGSGLNENPRSPPQCSQFVSWSRRGGTLLGVEPTPESKGPWLSPAERKRRMRDVAAIMAGELDGGLTRGERDVLVSAQPEDQNKPGILALRNKQRAALGWPLLDAQGRAQP